MMNYDDGLALVLETMREDYMRFSSRNDYCPVFEVRPGRNYDKIVKVDVAPRSGKCVVGFVVRKDTKKFAAGDMLKASSWNAPATNFARGSVFDAESIKRCVRWTGIS